jgi:hypothetical protein
VKQNIIKTHTSEDVQLRDHFLCEMATRGGLALFQNKNDLSPESDLTMVEKKNLSGLLLRLLLFRITKIPSYSCFLRSFDEKKRLRKTIN